ncbi:MAG: hypothetical protein HDS08_00715 [Bacteroides sp.]|nr:hypothetical protein [Bacteroides sp.]
MKDNERLDRFLAILELIILFATYISVFLIGTDAKPEFLHGITWWLYYAAMLYIPFVIGISGFITLLIHNRIEEYFPYRHILWAIINIIITILLTIIAFKNHFFVNQFIVLLLFSIEIFIVAFLDDVKKLVKIHYNRNGIYYMTNIEPKPYNGIFDYETSKEILMSDLSNIKFHRETMELHSSVNNGMESLLTRLSNGEYLLTDDDVKKAKSDLLTIYGGYPDDKYGLYHSELFALIKALYLLDRTITH